MKKILQHWCFPVNIAEVLRTVFSVEYHLVVAFVYYWLIKYYINGLTTYILKPKFTNSTDFIKKCE